MSSGAALAPPVVFGLVGHPVRWQLLRELAASDRRVRELTTALGVPQSLASYHLGLLRRAGVVFVRRSAADRRDVYYSLDLSRCVALLSAGGAALHPALAGGARGTARLRPARVLFLCSGNSARSQMAEALLRARSGGIVGAASAGSRPKPLHPLAGRALAARGVELGDATPKHWSALDGRRFEYVITLCDRVREVCPELPGAPESIHWSIPDPAAAGSNDEEAAAAFERTAAELDARIAAFLQQLAATDEEMDL